MADSPDQILENARAAAVVARHAAEMSTGLADQIATASGVAGHALSGGAIDPFVFRFAIFILAIFVGYYVVWAVTPALHTPLMAVTNAISSVIVVGALMAVGVPLAGAGSAWWARGLGFLALVFAAINIVGGFLVTQRMLAMYRPRETSRPAKQD